jgi:Flp pilus assembly protein TadD
MMKRTLIALSMTIAIVLAAEPVQTVHGVILTKAEWVTMNLADTPAVGEQRQEGRGNGFLRALKAPFKAIGRLFGRGKKNDDRLQRLSEKDIKNFKSTPADQIKIAAKVESKSEAKLSDVLNASEPNHLARGRELLNSGHLSEAITELSMDGSAAAHNLLGIAYEQKGLRDRALSSFETAVREEKDEPEFLNNYGFLLFMNGDYKEATKYLKRAAKLAPDNAKIWNNLGLAQCEREHFDDAYRSFVHAVGEFSGRMNIAAQLTQHGYAKEAIKHLEKAQALRPNSIDALAKLVTLYEMTGRTSDAENAQRSLVALRTLADANK